MGVSYLAPTIGACESAVKSGNPTGLTSAPAADGAKDASVYQAAIAVGVFRTANLRSEDENKHEDEDDESRQSRPSTFCPSTFRWPVHFPQSLVMNGRE